MRIDQVLRRLTLVPLLAAGFALPLPVSADPWKDESGKGRRGHESKDDDRGRGEGRGRGGGNAFKEARKHAEKRSKERAEHQDERRDWVEERRGRLRDIARRAPVPVPRASGPARRGTTAATAPRTASRPAPGTATLAPRSAASPYTPSTDARRRAAVSSYLGRHPGG